MRKHILTVLLTAATIFNVPAQDNAVYHVTDMSVAKEHGLLKVGMNVHPRDYRLSYNQRMEVTPVLKSLDSNDSIALPGFIVAGRNAFYDTERAEDFGGKILRSGHGDAYGYQAEAEWQKWMDHSRLELQGRSSGCCGVPNGPAEDVPMADLDWRPATFTPRFHYDVPQAEERKMRRIEGKAYVNFPVNRTEIYPDYMVNPVELRKITNSIDTVRMMADATVKSITLTGFASPEGPYSNNVRLAKGRTEAVKEYVRGQYTFPASVFHTNSVPEDWEGLRDSVAVSILPDRVQILEFIDHGNVPIEKRNDELRRRFPSSYAFLLKHVYPSLRHTNYAIDYELRTYTDINEIRRVLKEHPQNLSLNEFFLAANSYPVGSKEYDNVWETAVRYYPDNDIANLNAANSAMNEGNIKYARALLSRVSDNPSATYARAVLDAIEGRYEQARTGMESVQATVPEAKEALEQIRLVLEKRDHVKFLK